MRIIQTADEAYRFHEAEFKLANWLSCNSTQDVDRTLRGKVVDKWVRITATLSNYLYYAKGEINAAS